MYQILSLLAVFPCSVSPADFNKDPLPSLSNVFKYCSTLKTRKTLFQQKLSLTRAYFLRSSVLIRYL